MTHNYSIEDITRTGVYKITCVVNSKFYIGSASCINASNLKKGFLGRLKRHVMCLNKNTHRNIVLQNSWNKYTPNDFTFEILEFCDPKDCFIREQYYLDTLNPFYPNGFNICRTSLGNNKPQTKKRVYNRDNSKINLDQKVPVLQKTLDGLVLNKYSGINDASKIVGIGHSHISACCRGIQPSAGGYKWEYANPSDYKPRPRGPRFSIRVTDLLNNCVKTYSTSVEAQKDLDYCKSTIRIHLNNGSILEHRYKLEKILL